MSQLEDLLQECTVKLSLPGRVGWGTGFFLAPEWILTCHHVVRDADGNPVQVQWQQVELDAVVERSWPEPYDLALLRVTLPAEANPACVYLDAEIRSRDPLYLFGYPDQDFPNGCPVTFTCEGLTGDDPALIKFSLGQVRPGMSGSPLLNQRTGKVCGMVKFTRDRAFDLGGGAVPTAVILEQFPELVEQQRSLHQSDRRWTQRRQGAIVTHPITPSSIPATLSLSAYDATTWVGRDELITTLTQKLQDGCRILVLTGITGIGKTALAERLVVEGSGQGVPFHRLNFDDRGQGCDFLSGALALLPKLGETVTTEDQKDPQNALKHLLQAIRSKCFLIQIDSLEMLLQGNEQTGWNAFADSLWTDFFQQLLAGEDCQSQLLLTTQAIPEELEMIGFRYSRCWYRQELSGLSETEQLQLFKKNGLDLDAAGVEYLKQIGHLYQGHPLAIQVIARDILDKPFHGDVQLYWQRYQTEFDEIARDRNQKGGISPRALQIKVKQRVEQSLQRLPTDALNMLCRSSVYRRPVPESFWLAMAEKLSEDNQSAALALLKSHNLIEEELTPNGVLLLRQHNLVRSVARRFLKMEKDVWQDAERTAANVWLNELDLDLDVSNLGQVRGKLEAFHHYCEIEDWKVAKAILIDQGVGNQLHVWGYFRERIALYERILGKLNTATDLACRNNIGQAYWFLSDYPQAIDCYQKSLVIAREVSDRLGEGTALRGLGIARHSLGKYSEAAEYFQQSLAIAREVSDRLGEGKTLAYLGNAAWASGNYLQAVEYYQQYLAICREVGDRQGEGSALGGLGLAYDSLGDYPRAIEYHKQHLTIARAIGARQGEGNSLVNWGSTLIKLEQYLEAKQYLQISLKIFRELGERDGETEALLRLGELYYKIGELGLAQNFCDRALTLASELGIPLVNECEALQAQLATDNPVEEP
ncbi:tetratricopeptide repeat protein [Pantanalinema sp. GBBB05]|uniref:tetratricopeptide repeat protein n=1 Tax=Pantanalinema sp. GBBB05 TaxID=2604139 RepID=UPI001D2D6415|nr:tetratricopeptide repeat protein [Pantanalinema sp. GBBB05]